MILPRTNVFFSASNSDIPQCSSDSQRGQTCVFQCQGANIARALLSNVYCWPKKKTYSTVQGPWAKNQSKLICLKLKMAPKNFPDWMGLEDWHPLGMASWQVLG